MIAYRQRHGDKNALGKEAEVTLKLKFKFENTEHDTYSTKGEVTCKIPQPPAKHSIAMQDVDDEGKYNLFIPHSGSSEDHPLQTKLFAGDEKPVETKEGEDPERPY